MVAETLCKVPKMSPFFITISLLYGLVIVMKIWGVLPLLKFLYDSLRGVETRQIFVLNQTRYFLYILLLMYYFLGPSYVLVLELLTNRVHQTIPIYVSLYYLILK